MKGLQALIAVAFICPVASAQAQTAREQYDLQERCGKRAEQVFEKRWGKEPDPTEAVAYENHYNTRLSKCFYLERRIVHTHGKAPYRELRLFDLNENREIGTYSRIENDPFVFCVIEEKGCRNEDEWRELIKPFMQG